jgi:hypothetical protein
MSCLDAIIERCKDRINVDRIYYRLLKPMEYVGYACGIFNAGLAGYNLTQEQYTPAALGAVVGLLSLVTAQYLHRESNRIRDSKSL